MSDKLMAAVTSSVDDVENLSAKAEKSFSERSDASFQRKLLKLQNMMFRQKLTFSKDIHSGVNLMLSRVYILGMSTLFLVKILYRAYSR
jgi:hypothetical protein